MFLVNEIGFSRLLIIWRKLVSDEEAICCPYCGDHPDGSHFHCHINFSKAVFFCYFCGVGGTLRKLVHDHPSMKERVWLFSDIRVPRENVTIPGNLVLSRIHNSDSLMAKRAVDYLKRRGLTMTEIVQYQASISVKMPWYVIFPHDFGSEVFWAARAFTEGAKYRWFFPQNGQTKASKGEVVWGITRQAREGEIWLCEGIFDAIAVSGVCVFGKSPTTDQLRMILSLRPKRIIIAFDRDAAVEARALQDVLRVIVPTAVILPPNKKDYGDLLATGWRRPNA